MSEMGEIMSINMAVKFGTSLNMREEDCRDLL